MSRPIVYLAGPIAGATVSDATDWRRLARMRLEDAMGYQVLSPLRGKDEGMLSCSERGRIHIDYRHYAHKGPLYNAEGIIHRDFNDVRGADVMLVNLYAAQSPSFGTTMELGWAWMLRTPVVAWIETDGSSLYDAHPMLAAAIGPFRANYLDDALELVGSILGDVR